MLFDLRARGRKNVVKVVYLILAILLGGGLVFFGIGSDVSGGLFDAFGDRNGGGNTTQEQIERAQERTQERPRDAAAWAALARLQYQDAGAGARRDDQTGQFTDEGRQKLAEAARSWERYLRLRPENRDPNLAIQFAQAYGPGALNQPDRAVAAYEIYAERQEPSTGVFSQLAQYAYLAGQTRKGDLAADRAVELADKDQRKQVRKSLDDLKQQIATQQAQAAASTAPVAPSGTP